MKASRIIALACALFSSYVFAESGACIGKVVVKPGAYGAINQEAFRSLQEAQRAGNQAAIKGLVSDGSVVALTAQTVACIKAVQFHQYSSTLSVPGLKVAVLVPDDFVTKVETE